MSLQPRRLRVVGVDAAQDPGHLGARVVVGVDRVVDEAGVHLAVVQRALVAHPLVGAPLGARVDHRLRREVAAAAVQRRRPPRRRRCRPAARTPASAPSSPSMVAGVDARRARSRSSRRLPGCDHGELHVGRQRARRCARRDLDLVDLADQQRRRCRAGRAAASALPGSGPCSSSYSQVRPVRPGRRRCGCGPRSSSWSSASCSPCGPGDADRAVAGDRLRGCWSARCRRGADRDGRGRRAACDRARAGAAVSGSACTSRSTSTGAAGTLRGAERPPACTPRAWHAPAGVSRARRRAPRRPRRG